MKRSIHTLLKCIALASFAIGGIGTAKADLSTCSQLPLGCQWRIFAHGTPEEPALVEGGLVEAPNGNIVFDDPAKVRAENGDASFVVSSFQATADRSVSFSFSAQSSGDFGTFFFQVFLPITPIAPPDVARLTVTLDYTLSSTGAGGGHVEPFFNSFPVVDADNRTISGEQSNRAGAGGPCSIATSGTVDCGHIVSSTDSQPGTWVQMTVGSQFGLSRDTSLTGTVLIEEVAAIPEASSFTALLAGIGIAGWWARRRQSI
jgi:hypothetical protein